MKALSETILSIDQTNKTSLKKEALVQYFQSTEKEEWLFCIALFSGRKPKGVVKSAQLREWAAELAEIPDWLFEETYHIVGDLAETIAKILPQVNRTPHTISLRVLFAELHQLKEEDEHNKKAYILQKWNTLNDHERFVFNKMLTGGFRIGVSQRLLTKALAEFLNKEESEVAYFLMGNWDPLTFTFDELFYPKNNRADDAHPYPFCLAHPLEEGVSEMGEPQDWVVEYKWDGIRGQLVYRNDQLFIWSRGEELITHQFPEFQHLKESLPKDVVLDGEVVVMKEGKIKPFSDLQKRLGRKSPGKTICDKYPAHFIAYDLLEMDHQALVHTSLEKRRALLEQLVKFETFTLSLSKTIAFDSWEDVQQIQSQARSMGTEGLMIKRKDSIYHAGRKTGAWWKWKVEPYSIDAVMVYAMRGHGRRANLFSDYTFAVWHNEELLTITKAYSGLTDQEMKEVDRFVKNNTIEKFGPVSSVKPEMVFEIAFDSLSESKRHKSGYAFRFPRIKRIRKDKPAKEANTLEDVKRLYDLYQHQEL